MISIIGHLRPSLIGDLICSLPFAVYLEKCYPGSKKIALLDTKCQQLSPLLINAPFVDGVKITELPDKISPADEEYFKRFDMAFEPFAPITEENWYNKMDVREQTFKMSWLRGHGRINPNEWEKLTKEERLPRLTQWFSVDKQDKYVAIWANSGYSSDPANQKRNPSKQYWEELVDRLIKEGYKVAQLGTKDHELISDKVLDLRHLSLFEAVRFSLGSLASIGTDSGSMHCIGAYGMRQIILMTYWRSGHQTNPTALAPVNWKNRAINLFHPTDINKISVDRVVESIKSLNE